jgi:catechol 2,3-dioxygenase-like lactoylglutathione lyase family enzyme
MPISKVQLLLIPVSDQEESLAFFVNVLGFALIADQPMGPAMRWVQFAIRDAATSVALVTWFDSMPAGSLRGLVRETRDREGDITVL